MKTCVFHKMFWNCCGYNIEVGVNISRWLVGFGWVRDFGKYTHFNIGPIAISFYKIDKVT
jgi:hypothetical protein